MHQQEEEDNEPEQTRSQSDPACAVRKEDVKQSENLLLFSWHVSLASFNLDVFGILTPAL